MQGTAPITKNSASLNTAGATPIEKNGTAGKFIRVVGESGNLLEPTYPKRARGLVKAGRARYAPGDDNTIIIFNPGMTGPPVTNKILPEDNTVDLSFTYKAD